MADRPTEVPSWASSTLVETKLINNNSENLLNKLEPTEEFKSSGLLYKENLPRPYLNFILNLISKYIINLDERTSKVGVIHLTADAAQTVGDLANRYGGTWTARGTTTLGSSPTLYVFQRTA